MMGKKAIRNSSIELLKILAILFIIISHVINSLSTSSVYLVNSIDLLSASTSFQQISIVLLQYLGKLGNAVFFICTAWFLLDDERQHSSKALRLLADNWVISVLVLLVFIILNVPLSKSLILKSLFPSLFENNWYVSCYVIFLLLFPILNHSIKNLSKKDHARMSFVMTLLYLIFNFALSPLRYYIETTSFFSSKLIVWITVYLLIGYLKKYHIKIMDCVSFNVAVVIVGCICFWGLVVMTNYIGLRVESFRNSLFIWGQFPNPFIISIALASFNIARSKQFQSSVINYISSLSLFVYVIHENILIANIIRPHIWQMIYSEFGYSTILISTLMFSASVFIVSILISIFYKYTFHVIVEKVCNRICL